MARTQLRPHRTISFRASTSGSAGDPRHTRRPGSNSTFKPGDSVRETGIYEVLHDGDHRAVHEAVMLAHDLFPGCETCRESVRFRLVRSAPYIFHDDDFEN